MRSKVRRQFEMSKSAALRKLNGLASIPVCWRAAARLDAAGDGGISRSRAATPTLTARRPALAPRLSPLFHGKLSHSAHFACGTLDLTPCLVVENLSYLNMKVEGHGHLATQGILAITAVIDRAQCSRMSVSAKALAAARPAARYLEPMLQALVRSRISKARVARRWL